MIYDIEALRAAAKRLKKAFAAGDADAIARLHAVVPGTDIPKHADFLHTIAREQGHESWPRLKFALEAAGMNRDQRAERLKVALFHGQRWVVEKLLGEDPGLTGHNLGLEIATYNLDAARRAVESDPGAATATIGVRSPILHLAYSRYIHMAPEKRDDMLAIAQLLVDHGADPNDAYPAEPDSDHTISALYGALGHADNMGLAEWLLDHGASPDDNESLYHATELGHMDGLRLLMKHGVTTRGTNALPRALDFEDIEMARLLLEYGANPNEAVSWHPSGEPVDTIPALHQAARRWRSGAFAKLLLGHGADPTAVWNGHTAYATARIYGNGSFARVLEEEGHASPLSAQEAALARCAEGVAPDAPIDQADLSEEDRSLLTEVACGPDRLDHLKALVAAGFDPNRAGGMNLTPLHLAAWEGLDDRIAYLLTLDPDLEHVNGFGGTALGTVIHGSENCPSREERNYTTCALMLLEAGAVLKQSYIEGAGREDMVQVLEDWRDRQG